MENRDMNDSEKEEVTKLHDLHTKIEQNNQTEAQKPTSMINKIDDIEKFESDKNIVKELEDIKAFLK